MTWELGAQLLLPRKLLPLVASKALLPQGLVLVQVGQLMGLAIYNSVILDAHFPNCLYLKLLGKSPTFNVRLPSFLTWK